MTSHRRSGKQQQEGLSWSRLRAEWSSWFLSKKPVFLFGVKFGAAILLLYALLALPLCENILYSYLKLNALLSNLLLNLLGQPTHVAGVTIQSPQFAVAIRRGCDAVEPTWLYCGAILAYPGRFRPKLPGMLAGIALLQALNLVRIVTLYLIGAHLPALFNSAHLEIWPALFVGTTIMLFVAWKGWVHGSQDFSKAA